MSTTMPSAPCPTWCGDDLPTDGGGVVHVSVERGIAATAGGPTESGLIRVSIERFDDGSHAGVPAIRIEGSGDPLTPLQAFELAATLQAAAIAALTEGEGTP